MNTALAYDERNSYWTPPERHLRLVKPEPVWKPEVWLPRPRKYLREIKLRPFEIFAAIAFVNNVGTGVKTTTSSTVTMVPTQNCVAGNMLAIAVGCGGTTTLSSVTDTKSNTWVVDKSQGTSGSPCGLATTMQNGGALTTADTITATLSATGANHVCACSEFSGITSGTRLDQVVGADGTTATAVASGSTGALAQADELVLGAISWAGASQLTFAKGASYTASLEKDEGSGAFLGVALEYKIVSATTAVSADGTISAAPTSWHAICATYKAAAAVAAAPPRPVIVAPSVPVRNSFQVGARF